MAEAAMEAGGDLSLDVGLVDSPPGDAKRVDLPVPDSIFQSSYAGFIEYQVSDGDTLQSLAAKHLGDPGKAAEIAIINKLEAPYVTTGARMPSTVRPGDVILIPTQHFQLPAPVSTSLQQDVGQSQAERLLGSDFALVRTTKERFGWAVDVAHGSVDALKVQGIPNYCQGLSSRVRTEQGQDMLHPSVGMPRLVGVSQNGDNISEAMFRLRQQVLADPRTDKLLNFEFRVVGDAVYMDCSVQPVGYASSTVIPVTLR
jgi:hypothetical protein